MDITNKDVAKYQAIYKKKFGKEIDTQEARKQLTSLVGMMSVIYKPITKEQVEELAKRDAMKADAKAMAELTYDIYKKKKREQSDKA